MRARGRAEAKRTPPGPCVSFFTPGQGRCAPNSKAERRPRWTGAVHQSLEALDEGNFYGSCATMGSVREHVSLLDDLIRPCQHRRRDGDAESFRGLQVDDKLELARLLDREVGRLRALQYPVHVKGDPSVLIPHVYSVRHEAASIDK